MNSRTWKLKGCELYFSPDVLHPRYSGTGGRTSPETVWVA